MTDGMSTGPSVSPVLDAGEIVTDFLDFCRDTPVSEREHLHLPRDIRQALDALRGRIRRYVLIHGLSVLLAMVCGLFWLGLTFDVLHFQLRKLELPGWFRTVFLILTLGVVTAALMVYVLSRTLRGFRARALALALERRFPELNDRLITAVELSAGEAAEAGLGGAMLQRTIQEAGERVKALDLDDVFNRAPRRRWLTIAAVLLVSVLAFGVLRADAMERWFNAYVLLEDDYWEPYRQNAMTVKVIAQPGERIREFDEQGEYKHPRGADLTLLAEVPDGRPVPEDVTLSYRVEQGRGSRRGSVGMSAQTGGRFRHTLDEVVHPHQLWVTGGDYVNREPFRVTIVDPPRIAGLILRCDYPDYTGMDAFADQERDVQEMQVSLPVETDFVLFAAANKPLRSVQIRTQHFELQFGPAAEQPQLTVHPPAAADGQLAGHSQVHLLDPELTSGWFAEDRSTFRVPFSLSSRARDRLTDLEARQLSADEFDAIPLPPDTQLQIDLHDGDDIYSAEPSLLTINGTPDQPPVVDVERRGVRDLITRMAEIPVAGTLEDDYGLATAWFGYRLEGDEEFRRLELSRPPNGQAEFRLGPEEGERVERFRVLPLDLRVGQQLELTVFARDRDNLNGPHTSHGEVYSFRIVTAEELLAALYDKELNLRRRFEQIQSEVRAIREDLLLHRRRYEEGARLREDPPVGEELSDWQEQLRQISVAVSASADRNLHLIRKSHTESRSVEIGFDEIRAEMVNNRVDTPTALQRIDFGVLRPLRRINDRDFPDIDQYLGLFRLANEQNADPRGAIDRAVTAIDDLLARMDRVLAEMEQRKEFNEVVRMLQDILKEQEELRDRTQEEQERNLFDFLQ